MKGRVKDKRDGRERKTGGTCSIASREVDARDYNILQVTSYSKQFHHLYTRLMPVFHPHVT